MNNGFCILATRLADFDGLILKLEVPSYFSKLASGF